MGFFDNIRDTVEDTVDKAEEASGIDLDRDNQVGPEQPEETEETSQATEDFVDQYGPGQEDSQTSTDSGPDSVQDIVSDEPSDTGGSSSPEEDFVDRYDDEDDDDGRAPSPPDNTADNDPDTADTAETSTGSDTQTDDAPDVEEQISEAESTRVQVQKTRDDILANYKDDRRYRVDPDELNDRQQDAIGYEEPESSVGDPNIILTGNELENRLVDDYNQQIREIDRFIDQAEDFQEQQESRMPEDPLENQNMQTPEQRFVDTYRQTNDAGLAADVDNYLTTQARDSFQAIREKSSEARQANRDLNPRGLNPVSMTARSFAGLESIASEAASTVPETGFEFDSRQEENLYNTRTGRSATTAEFGYGYNSYAPDLIIEDEAEEFSLEDARTVEAERVRELQGTIGEISGPFQKPVETGNLIVSSVPRIFTSQVAEDENQKAPDVDPGSVAGLAAASQTQFSQDPGSFILGAGLGLGLEKTVSSSVRAADAGKAADLAVGTGQRLDPATGVGRRPLPGEDYSSSLDIAGSKTRGFYDFLKGDIQPKYTRSTEGKIQVEANPDNFDYFPRERGTDRVVKTENLAADADSTVDPQTKELIQQVDRTRLDVLQQKADEFRETGFNLLTNTRKGQARLAEQDTLPDPVNTRDKRPDGSYIDRMDRRTDVSDNRPRRNQRSSEPERNMMDETQFNRPQQGTGLEDAVATGVGLGLGSGFIQDRDQDLFFQQDQGLDSFEEVDQPQPPAFEEATDTNLGRPVDNFLGQDAGVQRADTEVKRVRQESSRVNRPTPEPGFGQDKDFDPLGDFEQDVEFQEEQGKFASSLTAILGDIQAEEGFQEDEFVGTGFEIRPLADDSF